MKIISSLPKNFKIVISIVLLTVSTLLLFFIMFTPQPIQIVLETGQEVTSQNAEYFSLEAAILLILASFILGTTVIYLYYNSEITESVAEPKKETTLPTQTSILSDKYSLIMPFLRDEEKKVFVEIKNKGELLQNDIVLRTGLSKVKITRILSGLESKNLIVRERYGLTNKVRLK